MNSHLLSSTAFPSHGEPGVQPWSEDVPVRPLCPGVRRVRPGVHAVPIPLPASQGWVSQTHGNIRRALARRHGV